MVAPWSVSIELAERPVSKVDVHPNVDGFAMAVSRGVSSTSQTRQAPLFFFFITLKPRVVCYTKSMSLKYEPASEPLHISVK